jgi:acyl-CoA synthetase (AMP-forming)/AMP-acid ligase II
VAGRAAVTAAAGPVTFNFADLWEAVAATVPDRVAVVSGGQRRSFAELDWRASRLSAWMAHSGVGAGDFVAVDMHNRVEYVEAMLAAYKLRAVPVNINYRYRTAELVEVLADAGAVGVLHDAEVAETVLPAARTLPSVRWTLECGSEYERAVHDGPGVGPPGSRSGDDPYVLYTGGTTGSPKGVVWRMEDAFFACLGGGDPTGEHGWVDEPAAVVDRLVDNHAFLPAAPLMHAAGMWTTLRWLLAGAKIVLLPRFDAAAVWSAVEAEQVNVVNIVGDIMARRLLDAFEERPPADVSSLRTVASGGAPLSDAVKIRFGAALPHVTLKDSFGSSETGVHGWSVHPRGSNPAARFVTVDTVVLEPDSLVPLPPGSPQAGVIARCGRIPLHYHRDPVKSAATFVTVGDRRCALTGDLGRLDTDGTLVVLGRASQCINTGGEKVHPEEVEAVVRRHPGVEDAVVVAAPDPVWGQQVVAVVQAGCDGRPSDDEIRNHCREWLADYKIPRRIIWVTEVVRSPAGKADYRWAADVARSGAVTVGGQP